MGALRQLDPGAFKAQVSSAVAGAKGDVEHAARKIDVSPRTLYHYLDTEPGLEGVETSSEREEPGERER